MRETKKARLHLNAHPWQDSYPAHDPAITGSARSWGRVAEVLADGGLVLPALHSGVRRPRRPAARPVPAVPEAPAVEYRTS